MKKKSVLIRLSILFLTWFFFFIIHDIQMPCRNKIHLWKKKSMGRLLFQKPMREPLYFSNPFQYLMQPQLQDFKLLQKQYLCAKKSSIIQLEGKNCRMLISRFLLFFSLVSFIYFLSFSFSNNFFLLLSFV